MLLSQYSTYHVPAILLDRQKQGNHKFKIILLNTWFQASLGYMRPCLKVKHSTLPSNLMTAIVTTLTSETNR